MRHQPQTRAAALLKKRGHQRGFALIVTLSLMIQLTVVAVGLLSLSSISLRTSSRGLEMARARANAGIGGLELPAAGNFTMRLVALDKPGEGVANVKAIQLAPAK